MCRPQVINFQRAKAEVDVWALAASLYFMLTGQFPRHFPDGMDRCLAVLENDAVPILNHRPKLPKKLADVIDAALRETPTIGFQTAAAFRDALEDSL